MVLGRRSEVLAWNRPGHALLASHVSFDAPQHATSRPVLAAMVFLDPAMRALFTDWPAKCRAVVGDLRLAVGHFPDDTRRLARSGVVHERELGNRRSRDHCSLLLRIAPILSVSRVAVARFRAPDRTARSVPRHPRATTSAPALALLPPACRAAALCSLSRGDRRELCPRRGSARRLRRAAIGRLGSARIRGGVGLAASSGTGTPHHRRAGESTQVMACRRLDRGPDSVPRAGCAPTRSPRAFLRSGDHRVSRCNGGRGAAPRN